MPSPTLPALLCAASLALASCGADIGEELPTPGTPEQMLRDSARLSAGAHQSARKIMRELCPAALRNHGRDMTEAQARRCVDRTESRYYDALRREGFDPRKIPRGE